MYMSNHDCLWIYTIEELFGVENLNMLLRSNFTCKEFLEISPLYIEVLYSISKASDYKQKSILTSDQFLNYNKNVQINTNSFYVKSFLKMEYGSLAIFLIKMSNLLSFLTFKKGCCHQMFYIMETNTKHCNQKSQRCNKYEHIRNRIVTPDEKMPQRYSFNQLQNYLIISGS